MHGLCAHPSETGFVIADLFMRLLCVVLEPLLGALALPTVGV